ncbi:heavy metal translocating P-type ATPase metal-binding domain-containing protein [Cerasicoccus maritimus]|uniref:heavy metal translocating P-type ATPase metal-binding domain-containing protein n=1 Tax=Cerasicoccus maritimus TaxID=490089 RepID=UPI00285281CD|nr:heavy metal translocating P-type ATPase metal-binding domain-containing protein [Cerasicoccus maritimus]
MTANRNSKYLSAQRQSCQHCGAPFLPKQGELFCCRGCESVSQLIHAEGLDKYYQLKVGLTEPLNERPFEHHDWGDVAQQAQDYEHSVNEMAHGIFVIEGVSCPACAWLAERAITELTGIEGCRMSSPYSVIELDWKKGQVDFPKLANALQRFGFILNTASKPSLTAPSKSSLVFAAVFGVNAFLLQLPRVLGALEGFAYARLFDMMSLLMAALTILCAGHFFTRWQRHRKLVTS